MQNHIKNIFIQSLFTLFILFFGSCSKKKNIPSSFTLKNTESQGSNNLSWDKINSEDFLSYEIFRAITIEDSVNDFDFKFVARIDDQDNSSFRDTILNHSVHLYYKVFAVLNGRKIHSNIINTNPFMDCVKGNFLSVVNFKQQHLIYIVHDFTSRNKVTVYDYLSEKVLTEINMITSEFKEYQFGMIGNTPYAIKYDTDNRRLKFYNPVNLNFIKDVNIFSNLFTTAKIKVIDDKVLFKSSNKILVYDLISNMFIDDIDYSTGELIVSDDYKHIFIASCNFVHHYELENGKLVLKKSITNTPFYIEEEFSVASQHGNYFTTDLIQPHILNSDLDDLGEALTDLSSSLNASSICFSKDEKYIFSLVKYGNSYVYINKTSDLSFSRKIATYESNSTYGYIFEFENSIYTVTNNISDGQFLTSIRKIKIDF